MPRRLSATVALVCGLALLPALPVLPAFAGSDGALRTGRSSGEGHRTERTYTPSSENIANPERGFYHHTETHVRADGSGYEPLNPVTLLRWRENEHVTQILRVFYLEKFAGTDTIDPAYLSRVRADFATARAAGIKVIVRFAYAQPKDDWPYQPPYGDAPKDRVLAHIAQLAPVLRANADVIATVQAGFIGLWGEGYYTDYFVADPLHPENVTPQDWANRREVFLALLRALPHTRAIQVRTMQMKQKTVDRPTGGEGALTPEEAFSGTPVARIGHHNDCFLASPDDFGTFLSDPITLDQEYLAQDSRFVPVGGETCNVDPPRSEWPSAVAEMERYHYDYLNSDYNRDVLGSWGANIEEARRRLGYRLRLTTGDFADGVRPGHSFTVNLSLRNDGFAAPYNPRSARLVLTGSHRSYEVRLPVDPRRWEPGTPIEVNTRICASLPPGRYALSLDLPAPERRLQSQALLPGTDTSYHAAYAIQLANTGVWDSRTGYNDLGQSVVVGRDQAPSTSCTGGLRPRPLPMR
ncbi:DUF4832 domain-containing protein [Actinopolymorpha sp. NPDC004070]|uniref:DUF4832 domain-containing protein n=1 Tax=Actinopolymorpha sp. NPDC004070 TaxID=3154548 RepID=UPI0033BEC8E0